MRSLHALLAAMPLTAALACGSSLAPGGGAGGTGGTVVAGQTGTGGVAGTGIAGTVGTGGTSVGGTGGTSVGGTGGTGGVGGIVPPPPPTCLSDLVAACGTEGTCQYQNDGDGLRICYAGGARQTTSTNGANCNVDTLATIVTTIEVRKPDGTLCYTRESRCFCGSACESSTTTWRNADGNIVARGTWNWTEVAVTCEGTGEICRGATSGSAESCEPSSRGNCALGTCP